MGREELFKLLSTNDKTKICETLKNEMNTDDAEEKSKIDIRNMPEEYEKAMLKDSMVSIRQSYGYQIGYREGYLEGFKYSHMNTAYNY